MKKRPVKKQQGQLFAHHRHTGKLLPHKHTSWPLVAFLLLCVGVLLAGLTATVHADYVTVAAVVYGPPPTQAAVITAPQDGDVITQLPENVTGTCPQNTFIKLYINDIFTGSSPCGDSATFTIPTNLFVGQNDLVAHVYNGLMDEGPVSATVSVTYNPPPPPPPVVQPSTGNSGETATPTTPSTTTGVTYAPPAGVSQLILHSEAYYKGYLPGDTIKWPLEIIGGKASYAVAIDWGDGTTSLLSRADAGKFFIQHAYKKQGGYHGFYNIKVKATDASGQSAFIQVTTVVNNPNVSTIANTDNNAVANFNYFQEIWHHLLMTWPVYGALLLMVLSFWLGELQAGGRFPAIGGRARRRHAH